MLLINAVFAKQLHMKNSQYVNLKMLVLHFIAVVRGLPMTNLLAHVVEY